LPLEVGRFLAEVGRLRLLPLDLQLGGLHRLLGRVLGAGGAIAFDPEVAQLDRVLVEQRLALCLRLGPERRGRGTQRLRVHQAVGHAPTVRPVGAGAHRVITRLARAPPAASARRRRPTSRAPS
jgi:hypothetical protein